MNSQNTQINLRWFTYQQNNSGGSFDIDEQVAQTVIIQAGSPEEADRLAENIGIYFHGCQTGMDCSCCGDRWSEAYDDGDDVPSLYGEPITEGDSVRIYPYGATTPVIDIDVVREMGLLPAPEEN